MFCQCVASFITANFVELLTRNLTKNLISIQAPRHYPQEAIVVVEVNVIMHRPVILFATLAIIGGSANAAQEESGAAPPCDGCDQGHRRQRGLGATNVEYVSEEPLTFETPEPEPVDRESLLANEIVEVEDEDEGDGEVMDDMHLTLAIIGANAQEEREAAEGEDKSRRLSDVTEPLTFPLESPEYFDNESQDEAYGAQWFPNDESEEWGEFEPSYEDGDFGVDSTYASEDGSDFFMDDYDEMIEDESGLPKKAFNAPIARRLRRLDDPVEAVEDMADEMDEAEIDWDRYLAEKESLREEYASVPIVSTPLLLRLSFSLCQHLLILYSSHAHL